MKIRSIITLIFVMITSIVLSVLVPSLIWIGDKVETDCDCNETLSIYNDTSYDYLVYNPSEEQIAEMKADAEAVVPMRSIEFGIYFGTEKIYERIIFIEDTNDIKYTEYTEERRLLGNGDTPENFLYIDYYLSKHYGVSLGDTITVNMGDKKYDFIVTAVYRTNPNGANGACLAKFGEKIKNALSVPASGVYVATDDKSTFYERHLANYKPMALVKSREDFTTDKAYEDWLKDFNNTDPKRYYKEKDSDKADVVKQTQEKLDTVSDNTLFASIICAVILLVGSILSLILNIRMLRSDILTGGTKKVILIYLIAHVLMAVLAIVGFIIAFAVIRSQLSFYYTLNEIMGSQWPLLLTAVFAVAIGCLVNCIFIRGRREKRSKPPKEGENA